MDLDLSNRNALIDLIWLKYGYIDDENVEYMMNQMLMFVLAFGILEGLD